MKVSTLLVRKPQNITRNSRRSKQEMKKKMKIEWNLWCVCAQHLTRFGRHQNTLTHDYFDETEKNRKEKMIFYYHFSFSRIIDSHGFLSVLCQLLLLFFYFSSLVNGILLFIFNHLISIKIDFVFFLSLSPSRFKIKISNSCVPKCISRKITLKQIKAVKCTFFANLISLHSMH